MNAFFLILFFLFSVSVLVIVGICLGKIGHLRVIDVSSIPEEHARTLKNKLILERLQRVGRGKWRVFALFAAGFSRSLSRLGRRAIQKLYAIEQYYQKLNRVASEGQHAYTHDVVKRMVDEAEGYVREEEYIPAEKIYIDIISHNPKSIDAYEGLGNLYLAKGEYDQARETLQFTLRLSPNDASVNVSLAELELKLGNPRVAVEYLRKAVGKRSRNPKYLDFYTETALRVGSLKDVRHGLTQLKKVNPDNQKIAEFEERFDVLKQAYIEKTNRQSNSS